MRKFFGFKKKKKGKKERLSPPEQTSPAPGGSFQATSPMFQYARNEFSQTVAAGTSNDDGRGVLYVSPSDTPSRLFSSSENEMKEISVLANAASSQSFNQTGTSPMPAQRDNFGHRSYISSPMPRHSQLHPSGTPSVDAVEQARQSMNPSGSPVSYRGSNLIDREFQQNQSPQALQGGTNPSYRPPQDSLIQSAPPTPNAQAKSQIANAGANHSTLAHNGGEGNNNTTAINNNIDPDYLAACSASNLGRQESLFSQTSSQYPTHNSNRAAPEDTKNNITNPYYNGQYLEYPPAMVMPDATYEEEYGDAYIGGPIRYVYPSGYQSMRPRSGPWKLSIVICMLFTWLSVFIVGHCSDYVDSDVSQYNQNEIDDDTLVIETRWCGSRLLYMMWAISMLVTGLAASYCSIIGYIKVRDFAVANSRSQPPGMMGKTDFYAQVDDAKPPVNQETSSQGSYGSSHANHYHVPIYQADGNPQFWGGHIYRPTQAAVAITSR